MKRRLLALLFGLSILLASCADTAETSSVADNTEKQESSTETSETEQERVMIAIGKERLEVVGVDISPDADGVYLFTPDGAEVYAADQNHTDYAVVNTVVAAVGHGVQIPQNGYVMRLVGVQTEQEIAVGTRITYRGEDVPAYLPERYVRFGDTVVEVGYKNTTRTAEQVGFLFDDGWYANSTCSNIWGLEIAVDEDGKVVTVNPSGQATSGNTPIPEGGFVLSVGADTPNERALRKIKVGDTAEYVEQPQIYTAKRYSINAKNENAAVGKQAGSVDDELCLNSAVAGGDGHAVFAGGDGRYRSVQQPLAAVLAGILCAGDGQLIGAGDGAGGGPQGLGHISGDGRLNGAHFVAGDELDARNAVGDALVVQLLQLSLVSLAKADDDGTDALERHIQLLAPAVIQGVALYVHLGHQGAGGAVETCVNDGGIGAGRTHGHVGLGIDQDELQVVPAEVTGDGAARDACADDGHIIAGIRHDITP